MCIGLVEEHSQYHGLNGGTRILGIPVDAAQNLRETASLVTSYGMVTLNQVRDNVRTYVRLPVRATQDSAMLFRCLMVSLSVKGHNKFGLWKDDTIEGHLSGVLLLKVIIRQSHVDTNTMTCHIRLKFTRLDNRFANMNFDAYKTSPDTELVEYVKHKEREYDNGWEVTHTELMQLVGNKYATRAAEEDFEGGEEKVDSIIALQAQVDELKREIAYHGTSKGSGSTVKSGYAGKTSGRPPIESWKKVAPTAAKVASGSKTVNSK